MKYRIISNGREYRVQYREWYSPIWKLMTCVVSNNKPEVYETDSLENAQRWIELCKSCDEYARRKWEVV